MNWDLFKGSSHCEEGLGLFAAKRLKNFVEFEQWFLPSMTEQAAEVRKMRKLGLKEARRRAGISFQSICWQNATEVYKCDC